MSDTNGLAGRVAVVTGGSRGIGQSIVRHFAALGCHVVFTHANSCEASQALVEACNGAGVHAMRADVRNYDAAVNVIKSAKEMFGRVDIVVNSAGIIRDHSLRSMTEEDWADVLDTNLRGTFNYSKAAVPLFMRQSSGRIINIISLSVKTFLTGSVLSTSMRMGVAGMAKLLSDEVGPDNITVNNVAPGLILTERVRDTLPPHKPEEEAQLLAERAKSIPVRRIGRPEELGDLVAFLASPLAGYITGATIPIDGGAIRATAP